MSVIKNDTYYVVTDPLQGGDKPVQTEEQGELKFASNDYLTVKSAHTAKELKQRKPWMLVTPTTDGRAMCDACFTVNGFRDHKLTDEEMLRDGWVRRGAGWVKVIP